MLASGRTYNRQLFGLLQPKPVSALKFEWRTNGGVNAKVEVQIQRIRELNSQFASKEMLMQTSIKTWRSTFGFHVDDVYAWAGDLIFDLQ